MSERRFEFREHVAIHLRRLAADLEAYLLSERMRDVANHARKAGDHVGERTHAARDRFIVHALRQLTRALVEQLQVGEPLRDVLLTLDGGAKRVGQRCARYLAERVRSEGIRERVA